MPRIKSLVTGTLLLALLAGLGWTSREVGRRMARAGWFQGKMEDRRKIAADPARQAETVKSAKNPEAVRNAIRRLKFLAAGSAYLPGDWETLAEVQAILSQLSAEELAEVHAAIQPEANGNGMFLLSREILIAWVRLDPAAALVAAYQSPRPVGSGIFASWAQEDPAQALDWLESAELPAELAGKKDELRAAALGPLLQRDFERATAEFLKLPPPRGRGDGRASVMESWASMAQGDPALREQLIGFAKSTGLPDDHARLNDRLFRDWPQDDALGLLTYLQDLRGYQETADIPALQRPTIDATAVGAAIYREYDRPALEWWMDRYGDSTEVPGPLQDAMIEWRHKYPDKVDQWFAEQPPSPQRDAMQAVLVPSLIAAGKMDDAVQAIGNIGDAAMKQSAIERLDYVWSKKNPDAAAAWRATLSR